MKKRLDERKLRIFRDICRKNGLKMTPQRTAIYKELVSSLAHPSANDIYKRLLRFFSNISLNTVNSNLLTFSKIGIIKIIEGSVEAKRFDGNLDPHHHFRCIGCSKITDFYSTDIGDINLPEDIKERYTVLNKRIIIDGICDRCR